MAVSRTGLPDAVVQLALKIVGKEGETKKKSLSKVLILLIILNYFMFFLKTLFRFHIAFIPLLIPPLLKVFNQLKIDRRLSRN